MTEMLKPSVAAIDANCLSVDRFRDSLLAMTDHDSHYPTLWARRADLIVHIAGLGLALFGGGLALGLAVSKGTLGLVAAVSIYAVGLIAMLTFSLSYNFAKPPFTTFALEGAWAWGMTAAVWTLAVLGMAGKLFLPGLGKAIWVVLYLALGWLVVFAIKPMAAGVPPVAMWLLAAGGVAYTVGVVFYASKRLKFRRAIWHGHVLAGAGLHYAAVLVGVVLTAAN